MTTRELTCIGCPLGCALTVTIPDDFSGDLNQISVTGNTCPRGAEYARKEVTDPRRIVTSTVRVAGGILPACSVKTVTDVPKDRIADVMKALKTVTVKAPVKIGDVVLKNAAGTGVDVAATKNVADL